MLTAKFPKSPSRLLYFFLLIFTFSCRDDYHFITDPSYRNKVREQFRKRQEVACHRYDTLFGVLNKDLTTKEHEALEFLLAYAPLSDLADYPGAFFLQNVRASIAARDTFPWGRMIPEAIFRHFVLPVRVNNENLDSSRRVFFSELKDRIRHLSMKEAALEVNHWCHEKVTYKASDGRTSSPLATVKTGHGRCGEESTFTTAALRAVAIPARQCYTPRWAHCDDNHAWVEVWIDGKWHYLGACEPEPDLDIAWFSEPAKRAMLVNTTVFGDYEGSEEILVKDPLFTRINILPNYTATKRIWAKVLDVQRRPVPGAAIEFQLYNYAEFFPLYRTSTDRHGLASLLTGYGDLLIWAAWEGKFGFARADVRQQDTVPVYLELTSEVVGGINLDFIPPPKQEITPMLPDSIRETNRQRLQFEDQLRSSYEATFIDPAGVSRLALKLNCDSRELQDILHTSRGNWRAIVSFLAGIPDSLKHYSFPLLHAVSEKDLRDIDPLVLTDALLGALTSGPQTSGCNEEMYVSNVLNPRAGNEWLKPFHSRFRKQFGPEMVRNARIDPEVIVRWIGENITSDETSNYSRAPLTPCGVYDLRVADLRSRNIFFVAVCRSFGIPARLEPASGIPQYYRELTWHDVFLDKPPAEPVRNARLNVINDPSNQVMPEYSIHYTIQQNKEGFYRALDYENSPLVKDFPFGLDLAPGAYLLVTGARLTDGSVLSRLVFTSLRPGQPVELMLTLRKDLNPPPVLGSFVVRDLVKELEGAGIRVFCRNGLVLAWLEPGKEPTRHFIADLKQKQDAFGSWRGSILLLFSSQQEVDDFMAMHNEWLPGNVSCALFEALPFSRLKQSLDMPLSETLPVVIFMNREGIIHYFSEGYRIGIGEELERCITRSSGH